MRTTSFGPGLFFLFSLSSLFFVACKSEDQPPPQQGGYPQQQQPYGQPAAGQPAPAPAPTTTVVTPAPAPAPGTTPAPGATTPGQMATPGPLALPCSQDSQCVTHRCNTAFGKCASPCVTDADCNPGNRCQAAMAGLCVPGQ